jgi:Chaperone of endosialidase
MTNIYNWSTIVGENATSDGNLWPEGQLPSTVNDSSRDNMASVARWRQDIGGGLNTGGSVNVYTLTLATAEMNALAHGMAITFTNNTATNTGASTLNVNGTGAKPIYKDASSPLTGGELAGGGIYTVTYSSGLDGWKLHGVSASFASTNYVAKAGDTMTGNLSINNTSPTVRLQMTGSPQAAFIESSVNAAARWRIYLGDGASESGGNAGTNFLIYRFNDSGAAIDAPLQINRATGAASFVGSVNVGATLTATEIYKSGSPVVRANGADTMTGTLTITPGSGSVGTTITANANSGMIIQGVGHSTTGMIHIRPNQGRAGYITITENAVLDKWGIGCDAGSGTLNFRQTYATGTVRMTLSDTGNLNISATTASNHYTQGALTVAGGVGIGKQLWTGAYAYITDAGGAHPTRASCAFIDYGGPASSYGLIIQPRSIATSGTNAIVFASYTGNPVGAITHTETIVTYGGTSDARLKEDLQAFDAGPILDAIEVHDFRWKSTGTRGKGVIAQDVIEAFADAVQPPDPALPDMPWMVDYSKFVPLLLQEVKDLRARVAALETQLKAA